MNDKKTAVSKKRENSKQTLRMDLKLAYTRLTVSSVLTSETTDANPGSERIREAVNV
jgi:hypothetical protein